MERYIEQFNEFFESDYKVMVVYGNDKVGKIEKVSEYLFQKFDGMSFMIRTNHIGDIQYWKVPEELNTPKKKTTTKKYIANGNTFYFESMLSKQSWNKTTDSIDIAIAYTIDSIKKEDYEKFMNSLYELKDIKKIVLVSWIDNENAKNFLYRASDYSVAINR